MNTSILHHKIRRLKAYLREVTDIAIAYKYIFHNNILKSYLLFAIAKEKHKLKKIKDERKFKIKKILILMKMRAEIKEESAYISKIIEFSTIFIKIIFSLLLKNICIFVQ